MTMIRATLAITWKELQVTFQDRGLLAILFLLPLVFASLFSLSQQGAADLATGATALTVEVFVVNEDEGAYGAAGGRDARADDDARRRGAGLGRGGRRPGRRGRAGGGDHHPGRLHRRHRRLPAQPASRSSSTRPSRRSPASSWASPTSPPRRSRPRASCCRARGRSSSRPACSTSAPPEVRPAVEAQTVGAIMAQLQAMQDDPPITVVSRGPDRGPASRSTSWTRSCPRSR